VLLDDRPTRSESAPGRPYATVAMVAGVLITGCIVLSAFTQPVFTFSEAVSDGAARPWVPFRRVTQPSIRRCPGAVSDRTAHRIAGDLLRHDIGCDGDWHLYPKRRLMADL
jgi:hypothetical protein